MTISDRIVGMLELEHPRPRSGIYNLLLAQQVFTQDEFDRALSGLLEAGRIALVSPPGPPVPLGSEPVHVALDWVDLAASPAS